MCSSAVRDGCQNSRVLPSAVQTRLPQLPSLRQTLSGSNSPTQHQTSAITPNGLSQALAVGFVEEASVPSTPGLTRPPSRSSMDTSPNIEETCDSAPSRELRYASNGLNILETAVAEGQQPTSRSQAIFRQQYLLSLTYLLHGVPEDLANHEKEALLSALPQQLQQSYQDDTQGSGSRTDGDHSLLHRLLASGVIQIFLFFQVFLPLLRYFIRLVYQFERTNQILERFLALGISLVDGVGKKGSDILGLILRSGNSRVVQLAAAFSIWWIQEVSNGIQHGVEECVARVEETKVLDRRLKRRESPMKTK